MRAVVIDVHTSAGGWRRRAARLLDGEGAAGIDFGISEIEPDEEGAEPEEE